MKQIIDVPFSNLVGKTIYALSVSKNNDEIFIQCDPNIKYSIRHDPVVEGDFVRQGRLATISGDVESILGYPITETSINVHRTVEDFAYVYYTLDANRQTISICWKEEYRRIP